MMKSSIFMDLVNRSHCSGLGIAAAEDDPRYPCKVNGPCAHQARLKGNIEGSPCESPSTHLPCGLSEDQDLRMGYGILLFLAKVMSPSQDHFSPDQHRPYRDLSLFHGLSGIPEGLGHPALISCKFFL